MAVQRIENNGDIQPHPCFCVTTVGFWRRLQGDWKPGYTWKNAQGELVTDTGGNLLGQLDEAGIRWLPLHRSNRTDVHPLFFGVYHDLVYHHGAAFRDPYCRLELSAIYDRSTLSLPTRINITTIDCVSSLMIRLSSKFHNFGARLRGKSPLSLRLQEVIRGNRKLSAEMFEALKHDPQFYKKLIT